MYMYFLMFVSLDLSVFREIVLFHFYLTFALVGLFEQKNSAKALATTRLSIRRPLCRKFQIRAYPSPTTNEETNILGLIHDNA
jgi:hypothetical protein